MSEKVTLSEEAQKHVDALSQNMAERIVNGYHCQTCDRFLITTHVDAGVTPSALACRKTPGCTGTSFSLGYPSGPIPAFLGQPTHEWYRPDVDEYTGLTLFEQEHVDGGGLLLREVAS